MASFGEGGRQGWFPEDQILSQADPQRIGSLRDLVLEGSPAPRPAVNAMRVLLEQNRGEAALEDSAVALRCARPKRGSSANIYLHGSHTCLPNKEA